MKTININYPWPALPNQTHEPVWTGHGFEADNQKIAVLSYPGGSSGWTDDLTNFHADTADSNHFIDRASRQNAVNQLVKHLAGVEAPVIMEIGCLAGLTLRQIRETMPQAFVIGADYVREPLEQLAITMPDVPFIQFDLVKCPLPDNSLDAVVLLNVLEHIENDGEALRQLYRILKPGGIAVIEVPAGPNLYDVYDKLLMHHRRYALGQLIKLTRSAGFQTLQRSHLAFFLYPGFWLVKQRNKRFLSQKDAVQEQVVAKNIRSTKNNRLFDTLMKTELTLGKRLSYPFGIRCLITCKKP